MKTEEGLVAAVLTEINRPFQASLLPRIDGRGDSHSPGKNGTSVGINRMKIKNPIYIKGNNNNIDRKRTDSMEVVWETLSSESIPLYVSFFN